MNEEIRLLLEVELLLLTLDKVSQPSRLFCCL